MRAELVSLFESTRIKKKLGGALAHWSQVASAGISYFQESSLKVKEMLRRMMYYSLSRSLNQWREESAFLKKARDRVGSALYRLQQQMVTAAFLTWRDKAADMRWQRQLMTKAVFRFTRRLVARAFGAWRAVVELMKNQGERCKVSLGLWLNGTLWTGLEAWRQRAGTIEEGREGGDMKHLVKTRSLWLLDVWARQRRLLMRHVIYHVQANFHHDG